MLAWRGTKVHVLMCRRLAAVASKDRGCTDATITHHLVTFVWRFCYAETTGLSKLYERTEGGQMCLVTCPAWAG